KEAITTAFMTTSSLGTLPLSLQSAKKAGISDEVASFSLPLGATVNMDGAAIRLGASVVFAANIMGLELSFATILGIIVTGTLASVGTAGVPGAGLIALSIVLTQAGLPIEVVALVAGVDAILGMGATACNITGDLVGAALVDKSERKSRYSKGHITTSVTESCKGIIYRLVNLIIIAVSTILILLVFFTILVN